MESKSAPHTQPSPAPSGHPAPPPDPPGSGEFEAGATVKDLAFFQERKGRVASALSILGSIIASENRPLIVTRLRLGPSASPGGGAAARQAQHGTSWIVPAAFLGSILCGAAGLLFLLDAERPEKTTAWIFIAAGAVLGIAAIVLLKKGAHAHSTQNPAPSRDAGGTAADGPLAEAERLAAEFRETVKPLATELKMTINLDDLDSLLGELKAYEEYGRDLEDFHVTQ